MRRKVICKLKISSSLTDLLKHNLSNTQEQHSCKRLIYAVCLISQTCTIIYQAQRFQNYSLILGASKLRNLILVSLSWPECLQSHLKKKNSSQLFVEPAPIWRAFLCFLCAHMWIRAAWGTQAPIMLVVPVQACPRSSSSTAPTTTFELQLEQTFGIMLSYTMLWCFQVTVLEPIHWILLWSRQMCPG